MRVVVTGVTGFVGRSLLPYLKDRGFDVIGFCREQHSNDKVEYQIVNYLDLSKLQAQLNGVDVVIHLAGLAHKCDFEYNIDYYMQANVESTVTIANAAKLCGVKRFIFVSSIAVNGDSTDGKKAFSEKDVPRPKSFYAQSKLVAERKIQALFLNSNTEFVILRPPLIYGADCPGNFQLLLKLVSSNKTLPFGALKNIKSMIYLENFLDSICKCLEDPRVANQVFVISDSESLPLNEIILTLMKYFHGEKMKNLCISPLFLGCFAKILGRGYLWKKFTSRVEVNSENFYKTVDWVPIFSVHDALQKCAKEYSEND